ncbi:hypothetical protein [Labrys miyagiensis]|uniref:hypothetical protein n=1 Tax=Labrys miyagiensis TaxID=346912 RepID=UPI0024E16E59|nr:hypothetical protein [Labrys miyagiensis]
MLALRQTLMLPDHCDRVGIDMRRLKQHQVAGLVLLRYQKYRGSPTASNRAASHHVVNMTVRSAHQRELDLTGLAARRLSQFFVFLRE